MIGLTRVTPIPQTWLVRCPHCEATYETADLIETDYGTHVIDGPERFPRCDACGWQFEVAPVRIVETDDA